MGTENLNADDDVHDIDGSQRVEPPRLQLVSSQPGSRVAKRPHRPGGAAVRAIKEDDWTEF